MNPVVKEQRRGKPRLPVDDNASASSRLSAFSSFEEHEGSVFLKNLKIECVPWHKNIKKAAVEVTFLQKHDAINHLMDNKSPNMTHYFLD